MFLFSSTPSLSAKTMRQIAANAVSPDAHTGTRQRGRFAEARSGFEFFIGTGRARGVPLYAYLDVSHVHWIAMYSSAIWIAAIWQHAVAACI
jgi:hypothetical protein